MSYISRLTQTATYWAPVSTDGYSDLSFASPTQILVRWQDEVDTFQDSAGEEFISDAIVYTSTALTENGWLYEGTSAETDPQDQAGASRIRRLQKSSNPSGSVTVYKNILG
jgi:hypothetical protein